MSFYLTGMLSTGRQLVLSGDTGSTGSITILDLASGASLVVFTAKASLNAFAVDQQGRIFCATGNTGDIEAYVLDAC